MAIIITAPNDDYSVATMVNNVKLFLAGGITNCPDWQKEIIEGLSDIERLSIYNPLRPDFDKEDPTAEMAQICWEYDKLKDVDILVFWFPKETVCPITLYELGKWGNSTNKTLIIGIHPEYSRKTDVIIQTSLARPEVDFYASIPDLIHKVREILYLDYKII